MMGAVVAGVGVVVTAGVGMVVTRAGLRAVDDAVGG